MTDLSWTPGRKLAAALMLSTALALAFAAEAAQLQASATAAAAAPASEDAAFEAFATSGYTYCDAVLLGGLWKTDADAAKITMGQKILNGIGGNIPPALVEARRSHACSWADTPHSYEDAERLAAYWKLPEPDDAKTKVAKLYTAGRSQEVLTALAAAPAGEMADSDQADLEAFAHSTYTYCDAKLISELWTIGIDEAKVTIGYKVRNNYADLIPPILAEARQSHHCEWVDTGLSYDDATALAKVWGVKTDAAKVKAAKYYTAGESAVVLRALRRG